MSRRELKECPFCGFNNIRFHCQNYIELKRDGKLYKPFCPICGCTVHGQKTLSKAIDVWNRRAESGYKKLQDTVGKWANDTFGVGVQTQVGVVSHLCKEVLELVETNEPEEAADCFLLLLQHAHEGGYDLFEEAKKKHEINLKRKWGKPDENGCIEHIREGDNHA